MPSHVAEFSLVQDFTDILDGKSIIEASVGPKRDAIILAVDTERQLIPFVQGCQPGWVSFSRSRIDNPYSCTIIRANPSSMYSIHLSRIEQSYPQIQPLDDNETLVVSARCEYNHGVPEENAVIYDEYGQAIRHMVFGDGIADVQVASDHRIWVSYFDEGVFGNFGWPFPPMGSDGLLCFDNEGSIVWRFHSPGGFDTISDCYALNAANDAVWIYYYTDFPIVRISYDGKVQGWQNEFSGARALAVSDQHVMLWGGYQGERDRCIVQTIEGDKLISPRKLDLRLPDGQPLGNARVIGRDSILHAFHGTSWYQFDLREFCGRK